MLKASTKKRFIAGAVCPECKDLDSLVLFLRGNDNVFECVSCGHSETLPNDLSQQPQGADAVKPVEAEEQAVKFIDPT